MIRLLIFGFLMTGLLILCNLSLSELAMECFNRLTHKEMHLLSDRIKQKKPGKITSFLKEIEYLLSYTDREKLLGRLCFCSLSGCIFGVALSLSMNNLFLALPLGFVLLAAPFVAVQLYAGKWLKEINHEMEMAMAIITESYKRRGNIILAIEENLKYLRPPILAAFEDFVKQVRYIDSDVKNALYQLKEKMHSKIFWEWLDALIACQEDKNIMITLTPIVQKISYFREVSEEVKIQVYAPVKTFFSIMLIGVVVFPLTLYMIQPEWLYALFRTALGQITLAIGAVIISFSSWRVLRIAKNAENMELE